MPREGTLVFCLQNLDFSGANQVILNIVLGDVHRGNTIVLSPKIGSFAARFVDTGVSVRVGVLEDLLQAIDDVFCVVCNTIMTCHFVVTMSRRDCPVMWILHEWWDDDMIVKSFNERNIEHLTLDTVKTALREATMIVFVCDSQRQLYKPEANSKIIFVGVPDPFGTSHLESGEVTPSTRSRSNTPGELMPYMSRSRSGTLLSQMGEPQPFVFLCLGIICPRKNQIWTVKVFKEWMRRGDVPKNAKLLVVGARRTRDYEIAYLEELQKEVDGYPNIEIHDVTTAVEKFYMQTDCLIITSLNEVTPMVISEAFAWGIPVISTNIAGIKEMYTDGKEGYLLDPGDMEKAMEGMSSLYDSVTLRQTMSQAARDRFENFFDVELMVDHYRELINKIAPPVILIDMDGTLVNWDKGFYEWWKKRSPIDRSKSYYMEDCVPPQFREQALKMINEEGFFLSLPPYEGALQAIKEMEEEGYSCFICTSPLKLSMYCAQEKLDWVEKHMGEDWLSKVIICQDKTEVRGDILIDDKPFFSKCNALWKHLLFDAPYNTHLVDSPRMVKWTDWRVCIETLIGKPLSTRELRDKLRLLNTSDPNENDPEGMAFFKQSKKLWKSFKKKLGKTSESLSMFKTSSRNDLVSMTISAETDMF